MDGPTLRSIAAVTAVGQGRAFRSLPCGLGHWTGNRAGFRHLFERCVEIRDQILRRLEPDRQPQQILGDRR